jgi:hypothetical protein
VGVTEGGREIIENLCNEIRPKNFPSLGKAMGMQSPGSSKNPK